MMNPQQQQQTPQYNLMIEMNHHLRTIKRSGRRAHGREEPVEKLLEDAYIKLPVVASDIFGCPGGT